MTTLTREALLEYAKTVPGADRFYPLVKALLECGVPLPTEPLKPYPVLSWRTGNEIAPRAFIACRQNMRSTLICVGNWLRESTNEELWPQMVQTFAEKLKADIAAKGTTCTEIDYGGDL